MLRHIVERTLDNEVRRLYQKALAADLGIDSPKQIGVIATRLRTKLADFSARPEMATGVRIDLPPRGYEARFTRRASSFALDSDALLLVANAKAAIDQRTLPGAASALNYFSLRYGASIWLVSPVNTTFVPSPTRVRIVLQRRRLEVLGLVDDHDLACSERPRRNVTDSSESLPAGGELVDHVAGVGAGAWSVSATTASWMAAIHGSSFSSRPPGRNPTSARPDRHQRAGRRRGARSAAARRPARARRPRPAASCPCRPARRGRRPRSSGSSSSSRAKRCSLERARRPHASGPECEQQLEVVADGARQRRLRPGAQHGELVLARRRAAPSTASASSAPAAYRQSIDVEGGLDRRSSPPSARRTGVPWCGGARRPPHRGGPP